MRPGSSAASFSPWSSLSQVCATRKAVLQTFAESLKGIFKQQFPLIHQHYTDVLERVVHHLNALHEPVETPFAPFCSMAINLGRVRCLPHKDAKNFGPGLCCIVPFGDFDPSQGSRLGVTALGLEFEVGPGVPIFIPSAWFEHYNTELSAKGTRGSIVFWTGDTVFSWEANGFQTVASMSDAEKATWERNRSTRDQAGIARFPMMSAE